MPFYLDDTHREWLYCLQVAGLTVRYTSDPRVSTSPIEGHPADALYTDVAAMLAEEGVSAIDESLDLMRSAYDGGSMTVRLGRLRDNPLSPCTVFGRAGRRAASAFALVTRAVSPAVEAPFALYVDADLSALSYPRIVHVGAEAMYATEASGDGTPEDPYTLTITARALGGTRLADHTVDPVQLDFPVLTTDEVVFFQQRPAILLAEPADGSEQPVVLFRGFLADPPKIERDGSVSVEIVSLSAALDAEVALSAPAEATTLVQGYHPFSPVAGSIVEVWQESPVWFANARDTTAAASGKIDAGPRSITQWLERFDTGLPAGHPRAGDVYDSADPTRSYEVTGTSDDGAVSPGSFDLAAGPAADVEAGTNLIAVGGVEARRAYIVPPGGVPEILIWPGVPDDGDDGAINRVNAQLVTDTILDDEGAFVSMQLTPGGEGEMNARFTRLAPTQGPVFGGGNRVAVLDWRIEELAAAQATTWPRASGPSIPPLASWSTFDPTIWTAGTPEYWLDGEERAPTRVSDLMWFPLVWTDPAVRPTWDDVQARVVVPNSEPADVRLYDVASAFYQRGEPYALVEQAIDITDGVVTITATERQRNPAATRNTGGAVRFTAAVVDIDEVVLPTGPRAGETVFRLFFERPMDVPSFGEFTRPGMEAGIRIAAPREDFFSSPLSALRWLLTNQNALGLTDAEVDLDSIDRLPPVPWSQPFSLPGVTPNGSVRFRDLVDGILRLTRTALVMRGPDALGRTRLTLISTGIAVGSEAVAVLDSATIAAEPTPSSDLNPEILNAIQIDAGWDETEEEFTASARFFEKASAATHGKSSLDTVSGYGFIPPVPQRVFAPAARSLFDTFGEYRRVWRCTVATHTGVKVPVGSVVQITHPDLIDHKGAAVVLATAVVTGRRLELWREGCELTLEAYDRIGAGWNASLRVTEIVDAESVRVAANAYSDIANPASGATQSDVDAFAAGDTVSCEPAADHGATVERVISSVTPAAGEVDALVVLDGAHGLAVGDAIVPASYASASALARRFAFMSGAGGSGAGATVMV